MPSAAARPDPEDAYEAALRAADALFTRPDTPRPQQPSGLAPRETEQPEEIPGTTDRGGRILRAIDEPPPPQFAALEAAYAPKRRGRKPGSKNKPKVSAEPELPAASSEAAPPKSVGGRVVHSGPAHVAAPAAISSPPASSMERIDAVAAPNETPRGERRTPWLRDRLKPGEGWKRRRLPRVCW